MLTAITPVLLTLNEAPNIGRTLAQLSWARDIVVVDSGSTDGTLEILRGTPRVRIFERAFTTHAEQWNFGLQATGISTEWVLALDADFVVPPPLIQELSSLAPDPAIGGYRASFTYCIGGTPLRGAAYPAVVVLFRRAAAKYVQDGHTQRVQVAGSVGSLSARILHDDRKPLSPWLSAQARYMRLEADKLSTAPSGTLGVADRMRRWIVIAPPAMFFYCLLVRGGLLDGRAGVYYALQRAGAELILSLYLLERRLIEPKAEPWAGPG